MNRRSIVLLSVPLIVIAIGLFVGVHKDARAQDDDSQSVPYQGQNTGRFQIYYSRLARLDTMMLDTEDGTVYLEETDKQGLTAFAPISVVPSPVISAEVGRYRLYFSALARADTFLLDTSNGRIWALTWTNSTHSFVEVYGPMNPHP